MVTTGIIVVASNRRCTGRSGCTALSSSLFEQLHEEVPVHMGVAQPEAHPIGLHESLAVSNVIKDLIPADSVLERLIASALALGTHGTHLAHVCAVVLLPFQHTVNKIVPSQDTCLCNNSIGLSTIFSTMVR